jgi:hypothetical protein
MGGSSAKHDGGRFIRGRKKRAAEPRDLAPRPAIGARELA